ncbi:hypothetical protein C8Q72DRAFT_820025 [Fomitopsis betulina]|nr:hypothetical protein C8Q72DRAFT_820025 [Fomitopsis betulina]
MRIRHPHQLSGSSRPPRLIPLLCFVAPCTSAALSTTSPFQIIPARARVTKQRRVLLDGGLLGRWPLSDLRRVHHIEQHQ